MERNPRYKNIEVYHATIPESKEGWEKAANNLMTFLLHAPDDTLLPECIVLIYENEPKALRVDFVKGYVHELDLNIGMVGNKPKRIYEPSGAFLQFEPALNPNDRIQRVEDIQISIKNMLKNNLPTVNARTN